MPGSNNAVNNLIFGLSIAGTAQVDADNANRRAMDAENRALQAEMNAAGKSTDRDLQRRLDEATRLEVIAQHSANACRQQLAEKEALLTEWMQSNNAFKRLARQYGKNLGLTEDQQKIELSETLLDLAEEDPRFSNTKVTNGAKAVLASAKP